MSPTTQLQKPLGVVFGLLSVLKVQVMLAWASAGLSTVNSGDWAVAAAGDWGLVSQDIPTAGGVHSGAARFVRLKTSEAVVGITWARV